MVVEWARIVVSTVAENYGGGRLTKDGTSFTGEASMERERCVDASS